MFIHIGNDNVIRSRDIIMIIDYSLITSSTIMEEMVSVQNKKTKILGPRSKAKSVVITADLIFYSSLSVLTLKKRSSITLMIKKFKNHSK